MKIDPTNGSRPRYPFYAVVDVHTGAVLSVHTTRRAANAAKTEHPHRVRGIHKPPAGLLAALASRLGIGGVR